MARIAGVDLPREKKVEIGLTYIFGIGRTSARRILTSSLNETRALLAELASTEAEPARSKP